MSDIVSQTTDLEFEANVINSTIPVLVDFWAPWCRPCTMISPVLDSLALAYDGKLKITKINIDDSPQTPVRYGVRSVPTLLLFCGGELVGTQVGLVNKAELEAFIAEHIEL